MRFIWKDQRYEFTCLPFGYSLAPRVFIKICKDIVAQLRLNSLRIVIFLDDILLVASSFAELVHGAAFYITKGTRELRFCDK